MANKAVFRSNDTSMLHVYLHSWLDARVSGRLISVHLLSLCDHRSYIMHHADEYTPDSLANEQAVAAPCPSR